MPGIVYLGGTFCEPSSASVPLLDRGYLLGDSIFETIRAYKGRPFRLEQHLGRLEHSARVVDIAIPVARAEIGRLVQETLARSGEQDAYIRVTLSRGPGGTGLSPRDCRSPVFWILVRPLALYPRELYEQGIRSQIIATRRIPAACLDPSIKSGNYLSSIMATRELDAQRLIEGVQLSIHGEVVSGTVSNLFLVQGRRLRTPDLASGCLPGITREAVLQLATTAGLSPVEERLTPDDLFAGEEMFFTNTRMEILPVAQLGLHEFKGGAPGFWTRALQEAWRQLVAKETEGVSGNEQR